MRACKTPCRIECEMIECRLSVIERRTTLPGAAAFSFHSRAWRAPSWMKSCGAAGAVGKTSASCALRRSGMRMAAGETGGGDSLSGTPLERAAPADDHLGASHAAMFNPVRALMGVTSLLGVRDRGSTVK